MRRGGAARKLRDGAKKLGRVGEGWGGPPRGGASAKNGARNRQSHIAVSARPPVCREAPQSLAAPQDRPAPAAADIVVIASTAVGTVAAAHDTVAAAHASPLAQPRI